MRVTFIVPYPLDRAPGQRFRFEQWLRLLPARAVDPEIRPLFNESTYDLLYRTGGVTHKATAAVGAAIGRAVDSLRVKADLVWLYREAFPLGPPLLERLIERRVPFVYDFDDAIFLGDTSAANAAIRRLKAPGKIGRIVAQAAITTVGNDFLAAYARRYSPRVRVIPTTIDIDEYQPRQRRKGDLVRVGWSGSRTTSQHLRTIEGALRRMLAELPIELTVIGDPDFSLPGAPNVRTQAWDPRTEIADISQFDIGLMPLPNDDWSRGKCGLKALQYMALEVPPIVSPVGVNTDIVTHEENGLLASTEDEWVSAVRTLVEEPDLRTRWGKNARATVADQYSGQRWAPKFLETLQEAAASKPG
ncbi:MAG: glycosyltransferase family 4 protein [Actinomycetota bacterium]